jgi:UDP-N-acetyl-2-amino-2-deoxyglucuronate dehydrogenase
MAGSSPTTQSAVRFGLLGPGKVAWIHAAALARIPGARLSAVAGRNVDRTRALADAFGARAEPGLDAMVDHGDLDALIVCTPHPWHADHVISGLRAGLHVLVEKPMALDPGDCRRMIDAAASADVNLGVVSQRRWYEAVRRVKQAIDNRRIGSPALATLEVLGWRGDDYYAMDPWRGTRDGEGGGVLVNQAAHQLDLLCWFLGPVAEADGWTANVNHPSIEVEDTAVAAVRFASGAIASVVASNSQRPGLFARIHVHGAEGWSVGVETDAGSIFVAGVTEPTIARNDLWTIPGEEDALPRWQAEDRARLATVDLASHYHELQLADFVDAIRDGREPAVTGQDGLRAVELMSAIYRAHAAGGRVRPLLAAT